MGWYRREAEGSRPSDEGLDQADEKHQGADDKRGEQGKIRVDDRIEKGRHGHGHDEQRYAGGEAGQAAEAPPPCRVAVARAHIEHRRTCR
jgi:hypothetical protein